MHHLPSVSAVLAPPGAIPYLVVKQDNSGTTFVISGVELPWLNHIADRTASTPARPIGAWTHPTSRDMAPIPHHRALPTDGTADPPF